MGNVLHAELGGRDSTAEIESDTACHFATQMNDPNSLKGWLIVTDTPARAAERRHGYAPARSSSERKHIHVRPAGQGANRLVQAPRRTRLTGRLPDQKETICPDRLLADVTPAKVIFVLSARVSVVPAALVEALEIACAAAPLP